MKPKEFWICHWPNSNETTTPVIFETPEMGGLNVIEKSAYDGLIEEHKKDIAGLIRQNQLRDRIIDELRAKLAEVAVVIKYDFPNTAQLLEEFLKRRELGSIE